MALWLSFASAVMCFVLAIKAALELELPERSPAKLPPLRLKGAQSGARGTAHALDLTPADSTDKLDKQPAVRLASDGKDSDAEGKEGKQSTDSPASADGEAKAGEHKRTDSKIKASGSSESTTGSNAADAGKTDASSPAGEQKPADGTPATSPTDAAATATGTTGTGSGKRNSLPDVAVQLYADAVASVKSKHPPKGKRGGKQVEEETPAMLRGLRREMRR